MYLTGAQSGKPRAGGRMRSINVGIVVEIVATKSYDRRFGGFFDAFLSAC
jgi:hypothetical protein